MADIAIEHIDWDTTGLDPLSITDVGDTTKGFFRMLAGGIHPTGAGSPNSASNAGPNLGVVLVEMTASDQLFAKHSGVLATQKVRGEVWRYTGPANGEHEFIVRHQGVVTFDSSILQVSVAISGIINEDNCVVFLNGCNTAETDRNDWESTSIGARMDGSGNAWFTRGSSNTGQPMDFSFVVVEFTGSAWSVGHAVSSAHDTADETVTMNTGAGGVGGSTFDVGNWDNALIVAGSLEGDAGGEGGLSDVLGAWVPGGSTTEITFDFHQDAAARNDASAFASIIANSGLTVYRQTDANYSEGKDTSLPWPAGAPTTNPLDELCWEWFCDTSGTGTAFVRGHLGPYFTSSSTANAWVHRTGNNVGIWWGVVDISGLVDSGPGPVFDGSYIKRFNGSTWDRLRLRDDAGNKASLRVLDGTWKRFEI